MRRFFWALMLLFACMAGCGFMDLVTGLKKDDQGNIIAVDKNGGIAGMLLGIIGASGGVGGILGGVGGYAVKAYRHARIVGSGGKDDDNDGNPDPAPEPPKSTP